MSLTEARAELMQNRGTQFDPDVVDAILAIHREPSGGLSELCPTGRRSRPATARQAPGVIRLALALALAASSSPASAGLPKHGVLVPGKSLAVVRLGTTVSTVRARLGSDYWICDQCSGTTWYFTYEHATGEPFGVGVSFRRGRADAIFTLGSPRGWRTREGLRLGDETDRAQALYSGLAWKACIGFGR